MFQWMKVAALIVQVCCLVSVPTFAQDKNDNCQSLRLLLQADLNLFVPPDPLPADWLPPAPQSQPGVISWGWAGTVRGFLGTEPMNGILYYLPPTEGTVQHGQTGHEMSNVAALDFGDKGKFETVADGAVFQMSPSISPHMVYPPDTGFGHYSATVKIDSEKSAGATGNISISGLFLVNGPTSPPILLGDNTVILLGLGIWNAEIAGKVCK
jgi:hypothetical protein